MLLVGFVAPTLYLSAKLFTPVMFVPTRFTFAIDPPTKFTFAISFPVLFTLAIDPATKEILLSYTVIVLPIPFP